MAEDAPDLCVLRRKQVKICRAGGQRNRHIYELGGVMFRRRVIAASVAGVFCGFLPAVVHASGFALIEQNASGLGNAYAGQAAAAEDASTIFFNPAGLTRLPGKQAVVTLNAIKPSAKFQNTGTTAATGGFPLGGSGGNAGDLAPVPNAYFSWQLNNDFTAGVGIGVPFGLKTEYDTTWMGRFHALKSEIKTVNLNPSLAWKVNDRLSLGAGINWQRVEAQLTKAVNYTVIGAQSTVAVAANTEGSNNITGDDDTWGYNLGLLFKATPDTDIGLAYRSSMAYKLGGSVVYAGRPAALQAVMGTNATATALAADGAVTADLKLPASFSLAVKHRLNASWDLLADASWTEWNTMPGLNIVRSSGFVLDAVPYNWTNTWRFGVGANYHTGGAWTFRGGVAYDQSPIPDAYRTPRIPDQDRTWLAFGAQYKVSRQGAIDFGYAHLFVRDAPVNLSGPPALAAATAAARGPLVGNSENQVDILSIQYRHTF